MSEKTIVIAEAGVNHNGDLALARSMIEVAAESGADFVKFQTFDAARLVTADAARADYQILNSHRNETQREMLRRLQLSNEMHQELVECCKKNNVGFLSTGFDTDSVDYLVTLGQNLFKVPSGSITDLPYLQHVARLNGDVILSTGMATLGEVESAVEVLECCGTPRNRITVLHCTSEYPTPMIDVNLRAMRSIGQALGVRVGYSDHTSGIEIALAAVALGAKVVEKHFTLDRSSPGPDHMASIEPLALQAMISAIRNIEIALGSGIKKPCASELKNRLVARKSIVAKDSIKRGEVFTAERLTVKRPGSGISPMRWHEIVGRIAQRDYAPDELIEL